MIALTMVYYILYIATMPKSKGPRWDCVELVQEQPPRVKCTLCDHEFPGTGSRIADHLARVGNQVVCV